MWQEWRNADSFPSFVHKLWSDKGGGGGINVFRNLSKISSTVKSKNTSEKKLSGAQKKSNCDAIDAHLIDEREVFSVLFNQVENMAEEDEEDDEDWDDD